MMPPLARACLAHLRDEEAALRELHRSLSTLRTALLAGDTETIAGIIKRQAELSETQRRVAREREFFRAAHAEALGIPVALATIGRIIAGTPEPWASELRAAHERLIELNMQNRELGRRVAATLACCRSFTRGVLARLTGGVERYGPTGARLGVSA